jgi:hypothetical protein
MVKARGYEILSATRLKSGVVLRGLGSTRWAWVQQDGLGFNKMGFVSTRRAWVNKMGLGSTRWAWVQQDGLRFNKKGFVSTRRAWVNNVDSG